MDEVCKTVRVAGRVQGVGFRAWTKAQAEDLGLRGWVRNERDGSVTAMICGGAEQVDRMLSRLRDGPAISSVSDVLVQDAAGPSHSGFEIRH